jgi:hypothetical protein
MESSAAKEQHSFACWVAKERIFDNNNNNNNNNN